MNMEECHLSILLHFYAKEYKLTLPAGPYEALILNADEVRTLQDAMFVEWCQLHGMFHLTGSFDEAMRWLYEMQRP